MSTTVSIDFNASQILEARGLGQGQEAQAHFTNEFYRISQPYTPWDQGTLAQTVDLEKDSILYKSPYSQYQYYGKVMAGNPKEETDKNLNYQGAPMRGAYWDQRCWADRGTEILQSVQKFIGGNK
jgi:hypothetical protein